MSNVFLYVVSVMIWGTTWFAIEFQLGTVAPEVSVSYRYLAASVLLIIWCKYNKLPLKFQAKSHIWFALMGLTMFCLNYILAYRAQVHITSALAAIAFASILWMNILNARIFFGVRGSAKLYTGAALGIAGLVTVFGPQVADVSFDDAIFLGCFLALLGALMASFGNMAAQVASRQRIPVVQSNAWSMLYGALFTTAAALLLGHEFNFDPRPGYVVSLIYLTVFGSILAFGAYLTLLGRIGAQRVGYVSVMFPVVALIVSMLFEGLSPDPGIVLGFGLVLAGNVLVLTDAGKAKA